MFRSRGCEGHATSLKRVLWSVGSWNSDGTWVEFSANRLPRAVHNQHKFFIVIKILRLAHLFDEMKLNGLEEVRNVIANAVACGRDLPKYGLLCCDRRNPLYRHTAEDSLVFRDDCFYVFLVLWIFS